MWDEYQQESEASETNVNNASRSLPGGKVYKEKNFLLSDTLCLQNSQKWHRLGKEVPGLCFTMKTRVRNWNLSLHLLLNVFDAFASTSISWLSFLLLILCELHITHSSSAHLPVSPYLFFTLAESPPPAQKKLFKNLKQNRQKF